MLWQTISANSIYIRNLFRISRIIPVLRTSDYNPSKGLCIFLTCYFKTSIHYTIFKLIYLNHIRLFEFPLTKCLRDTPDWQNDIPECLADTRDCLRDITKCLGDIILCRIHIMECHGDIRECLTDIMECPGDTPEYENHIPENEFHSSDNGRDPPESENHSRDNG